MLFNLDHNKVLYAHYRKTDNQIFYIGYGSPERPFDRECRNIHWKNVVNKHDYYVKILQENLTEDQAKELEIKTIAFYGRQVTNDGPLVNITEGGSGGITTFDERLYEFKHKDGTFVKLTQVEFRNKFDINWCTSSLVNGERKSRSGWTCLNPNKKFESKISIYEFIHKDGTVEKMSQVDLCKKYDLDSSKISAIVRGKRKSHKGWQIKKED